MIGVYKITCIPTGEIYIGGSISAKSRWSNHKSELKRDCHKNYRLQKAWDEYGEKAFEHEMLEECSKSELREREQCHMDALKPEFNINLDAKGKGKKVASETKTKIGKAMKGRRLTEETKAKISKAWTPERREIQAKQMREMNTKEANQ